MQYSSSSENYSSSLRDSPSKWKGKEDKGYVYKKSAYQYSSTGNNSSGYVDKSGDKSIDQLDALLEDLKNERQVTRDRDLLSTSSNYRTIERERAEPAGLISKTTRVVKTSQQTGSNQVLDDVENFSTSDYSTLKSNGYSSLHNTLRSGDYQTREKIYGTTKNVPGNIYESRSKIYESNRTLENTELIPATSTTSSTHLEKDLQNIALSDDILPVPGTKVTTTVRTYTYEIPSTGVPVNRSQLSNVSNYSTIQRNEINTLQQQPQPQPHPLSNVPQTTVYNTEHYSTINRNTERPIATNQTYELREHRETNTTRSDLLPPQSRHPPSIEPSGGTSKTIVYNVNTTENVHTLPEHGPGYYPRSPAHSPNVGLPISPQHGGMPALSPPGPTTNRYFYKESSNVVNTIHGPPSSLPPPHAHDGPHAPPSHQLSPSGYPPYGHGPPNTTNVTYKYSSSSTTNTRRGPPDYGAPAPYTSSQPSPFPVDGVDYPLTNGNPPQRVDDLMQSFGNTDTLDRSEVIETPHRKREVETAVASPNQPQIPSVNRAGKEVYYPPGHDVMITKREEMSAAGSAGGGRWAKGSGMYEYESGYKSKTKTKSGGAMVPVCLPLCCAMPCSIM